MVFQSGILNRMLGQLARESDIRIRSHLCSRIRYPRSGCKICLNACPCDAVNILGQSVVLGESCSGCEICIPSCPNGVFTLSGRKEMERRERLKKELESDSIARWTCIMHERKNRAEVMVLPCLAGLSEAYLIAPFAWGAKEVLIKRTGCETCPFFGSMKHYEQLLVRTRKLLSCFGISGERIKEVEDFDLLKEDHSDKSRPSGEGLGRRELFSFFRKRTLDAARDLIPDSGEDPGINRWSHRENPMRSFLFELLPLLGGPLKEKLSFKVFPVVDLEISGACIGCNVCETLCPTGAIRREPDEEGKKIRIFFNASKCTGCRICGEACLPKAVSFKEEVVLQELLQGKERELMCVSAKSCRICGEPFLGLLGETCPQCLGSRQKKGLF